MHSSFQEISLFSSIVGTTNENGINAAISSDGFLCPILEEQMRIGVMEKTAVSVNFQCYFSPRTVQVHKSKILTQYRFRFFISGPAVEGLTEAAISSVMRDWHEAAPGTAIQELQNTAFKQLKFITLTLKQSLFFSS